MTTGLRKQNGSAIADVKIGISACLLGEKVRFDGGHKRDGFINETLSQFVQFVPICPEVDIGLGTPRESLRLVRDGDRVRMIAPKSGADHTTAMERHSRQEAKRLGEEDLCGYIFKKDSPTCGVQRVRVYDHNGVPSKNGRGLFAAALIGRNPLLPVEEEGRLRDPRLRENFFERVFAYWRLKNLFASRWRVGDLVRFHTSEKLLLMAHDPKGHSALGKVVAGAKGEPRRELVRNYRTMFMDILIKRATVRKHCNVLHHVLGHFRKLITDEDRSEILEVVEDFRHGHVPLVVPVTLLRHHVRRHGVSYLRNQSYLEPHPKELMLRNHV